jgi:RNA polymerase sigma-54 factor
MALRTRLELRQVQRLGLSAGVLASLNILRLSAGDLAETLAREAEANPFLLPGLPPPSAASGPAQGESVDLLSLQAATGPDWQMHLLQQLALQNLPPRIARLAAFLVGELDERGWLDTPLADLSAEGGHDPGDLDLALQAVQRCEPAGVGARDLDECLRLQLIDLGLTEGQARATLAELPRFARRDWAGLARVLGLTQEQALARAALLRRLSPRPVSAAPGPAQQLRPDLVLTRGPLGTLGVELARDHLPRPSIDLALMQRAQAQGFGTDLLARAQALVRAVDSRGGTLLKIGQWLVQRQEPALARGLGALRAATRAECAADLGLHPSTVGRAVQGKALLADGRLWLLATLFSTPAPGTGEAGDSDTASPAAARAIAHRIAALIAAEPPARPRSDQAIARMLATEGVDIARRTVAKYRTGLHIPAAHLRRTPG